MPHRRFRLLTAANASFFQVFGAFLAGTLFGSFANVVAARVPAGQSIAQPGSRCPRCAHPIAWFDNIPILSYLILGGRCRHCGEAIGLRYPAVELAVGLLWAALTLRFGFVPVLPAFLGLAFFIVVLSAVDIAEKRLPNAILGPAAIVGAALLSVAALLERRPSALLGVLGGGAAYGALILALALIAPRGMGMGDVKFAPYLGLHLGWLGLDHVAVGAFMAFLLGGLAGLVLVALNRAGMKSQVPFGPYMGAGALVAVFWGSDLIRWWLPS